MNYIRFALLFCLAFGLSTKVHGFAVLPTKYASRSHLALVPEQAKDLEAFYECECELQAKRKALAAAGAVSTSGTTTRGPILAWCRRVWSGVGSRNDQVQFRRQTSSTAAHKAHHPTTSSE